MRLRRVWLPVVLATVVVAAGCGGGDDDSDADATTPTEASVDPTDDPTDDTAAGGEELPAFADDWGRVCTTQVGYPGATDYVEGPGPHTVVYMEDVRGEGNYIVSARTLPDGWALVEDADFEDNSEFAGVELVACSQRTGETPLTDCQFDDDGEEVTLELVDADYEVTIYEATTGETVTTLTVEAADKECPLFASWQEGDTQIYVRPTDDEVINAIKPIVAPG